MMDAFPLEWPRGVPRTAPQDRETASFGKHHKNEQGWNTRKPLTIRQGTNRVLHELELFGVDLDEVVISSDLRLRRDGLPVSRQAMPDDRGVAVYFRLDDVDHCMPCDCWDRIADNLAAVAKQLEAMRGMERWGVGASRAAFAGFKSLPPASSERPWWDILDLERDAKDGEVRKRYRQLCIKHHPDKGGDADTMANVTRAWRDFKEERGLR